MRWGAINYPLLLLLSLSQEAYFPDPSAGDDDGQGEEVGDELPHGRGQPLPLDLVHPQPQHELQRQVQGQLLAGREAQHVTLL